MNEYVDGFYIGATIATVISLQSIGYWLKEIAKHLAEMQKGKK